MAAAKRSGSKSSGRSGAKSTGKNAKNAVPRTRATGEDTATGTALADRPIPKGKERGSQVPIVGGQPPADLLGKPGKPRGAQKEPAEFTSNGQIEYGTVATPSGPVPVSTRAGTQKEADKITEENRKRAEEAAKGGDRVLDEATVNRLGRAELMAIASQRGYELPENGTRVTRESFLRLQKSDKNLRK